MSESNTIYDCSRVVVGVFRHGIAWLRKPHARLGTYDYGEYGFVYNDEGEKVAAFRDGSVTDMTGAPIGEYCEVPFVEMNSDAQLPDATVKKLIIGSESVGWCIGNEGSAAAAIVLIFRRGEDG